MPYLADYMHWSSGTECPPKYRIWSGISLLGHVMGCRFWYNHGRYPQYPSLYVALVGEAGSGKSTAKNAASEIFTSEYPLHLASASFQSHQDIIDLMCNTPEIIYDKPLPTGGTEIKGYTPFYIISNELASLLSTDKQGMVTFLIDGYDTGKPISTGYKGQRREDPARKQKVDSPHVSILGCAVPKWFMGNLKQDLFDLGLGRRLIIVYDDKVDCVPDPIHVQGGEEARARVVKHLHHLDAPLSHEIKRSKAAADWWHNWYPKQKKANQTEMDPILKQFGETEAIQVIKVAMVLSMCEYPFTYTVEPDHFEFAKTLIEELKPNIVRLTSGIGRNELAGVGAQLIDYLQRTGGASTMQVTKKIFRRYADRPEFRELIGSYIETDDIFLYTDVIHGVLHEVLMLPDYFVNFMKDKKEGHPVYPAYTAYLARRKNGGT